MNASGDTAGRTGRNSNARRRRSDIDTPPGDDGNRTNSNNGDDSHDNRNISHDNRNISHDSRNTSQDRDNDDNRNASNGSKDNCRSGKSGRNDRSDSGHRRRNCPCVFSQSPHTGDRCSAGGMILDTTADGGTR
ncbi:hypothetical protein V5735_03720 (plasmid) [Haladaptatus sp. SPP-AMP-3]|uniref:hypothetical protein n=1 Tax=Haladaptatus sp. SPP-AMP-3 TaxID=3121295 RepID=UPI003C2B72FE